MSNHISPESAEYLSDAVRRGIYRDEEQALDEAITLLKQRDRLRADVQAGIDEADRGELISAEQVFKHLTARAKVLYETSTGTRCHALNR